MNYDSARHAANAFEALAKLLMALAVVLLSFLGTSGLVNLAREIPFTTDAVVAIEQYECSNFTSWEMTFITTEKGYQFSSYHEEGIPEVGDVIWLSFWEANLGWFHMGTCTLVEVEP